MESSISGVGVIDKAVSILRALAVEPMRLNDLVEVTGFSRATAHRLATALEAHGLVRRGSEGRFALGAEVISLGRAAVDAMPLAQTARPALVALRDATGESVQLYIREGDRRVCIAALESPHGLRTIVPLGASLPLELGSAGRLLGEDSRDGPEWVASVEEREPGVASVSAPVRDASGNVLAAVSVSGPVGRTGRTPGEQYGELVAEAARSIEAVAALQ